MNLDLRGALIFVLLVIGIGGFLLGGTLTTLTWWLF